MTPVCLDVVVEPPGFSVGRKREERGQVVARAVGPSLAPRAATQRM